jgi:hypothetical protein
MISMVTFIGIFAIAGSLMTVWMESKRFKKDQKNTEDELGGQENQVKTSWFKRKPKDIEPVIVTNPKYTEVKADGTVEGRYMGVAKARHRKKGDSKKGSIKKVSKRTRTKV